MSDGPPAGPRRGAAVPSWRWVPTSPTPSWAPGASRRWGATRWWPPGPVNTIGPPSVGRCPERLARCWRSPTRSCDRQRLMAVGPAWKVSVRASTQPITSLLQPSVGQSGGDQLDVRFGSASHHVEGERCDVDRGAANCCFGAVEACRHQQVRYEGFNACVVDQCIVDRCTKRRWSARVVRRPPTRCGRRPAGCASRGWHRPRSGAVVPTTIVIEWKGRCDLAGSVTGCRPEADDTGGHQRGLVADRAVLGVPHQVAAIL